tara:strand:- start:17070 stop:18512 length:1443 start_codon:yes stop_codon:yes gene_type:complete
MSNVKKFWVGGALNMAAGAYGAIAGGIQERNARKKMAMAAEEAASPIRTQAARQRVARQEGDAQSAMDSALRAEATAAQQLAQSGGSRALAGRTASLQRAAGMSTDRALQQFGDYGARLSAAEDASQVNQINQRLGGNLNRLQRAADAGRAQTYGGIAQGLGGLAQVAGSLSKPDKGDDTDVSGNSLLGDQTDSSLEVSNMAEGVPEIGSSKNANPIGSYDITGGRTQTVQDLSGAATPGMIRAAQMMSEITPPRSAPRVDFGRLQEEPFVPQVNSDAIELEDLPIGGAAFKENITTLPEMEPIDSQFPLNTATSENIVLNPDGSYNLYDDGSKEYDALYQSNLGSRIYRSPGFAKKALDADAMIPFEEAFMYNQGGMQPTSSGEEVDALKAMLNMVSTIKKDISPSDLEEEVRETPGEFDHDDNPIDIVQGEEKIGEMTGGEYIFNPEQAEMLKQLSNKGDSELHEFIRNLLSKEQFNG